MHPHDDARVPANVQGRGQVDQVKQTWLHGPVSALALGLVSAGYVVNRRFPDRLPPHIRFLCVTAFTPVPSAISKYPTPAANCPSSSPVNGISCPPRQIPTMPPSSTSSPVKKEIGAQVETVHTNERVPGHADYYEKDGLRTYGDDGDHDHEPPVRSTSELPNQSRCSRYLQMTFKRIMSLIAMAFLWTGSQIPLYVFGRCLRCRFRLLAADALQAVSLRTSIATSEVPTDGSGL